MTVCSPEFLVPLLSLSMGLFCIPGATVRRLLLTGCNLAFLWLWMPGLREWLVLGGFVLSGLGAGWLLNRRPSRWLLAGYLVLLLGAFVYLKRYQVLGLLLPPDLLRHPLNLIGLSYILFRQIHFVVDAMQGQIERFSLWTYLNYQFNLLALLSGPIVRYQDFETHWRRQEPVLGDASAIGWALFRVLIGVIKVGLISQVCQSLYLDAAQRLGGQGGSSLASLVNFVKVFYGFPLYLYFNFSGYCDIVIGAGGLLGQPLPENFDRPYLARNLLDFWNRWHQTLTHWIRDYLFTPLYKALVERWPARAAGLAVPCFFVALVLAGIWHGATWNFVVYGLLQGAGVAAAKLWENRIIRRRGRKGLKAYLQLRPVRVLAVAATWHYTCFSLLFFPFSLSQTAQILGRVWSAVF